MRPYASELPIVLLVGASLLACSEGADLMTPDESAMSALTIVLGTAPAARAGAQAADGGNVPRDAVDAIGITVVAVEVHPAAGGGWIGLDVQSGGALDLLMLPAAPDGDPLVIARGELAAGDYTDVRLFLADGGSIELNRQVCLDDGDGPCLAAGSHAIRIPSAPQTGVKTDAGFTIDEGSPEETVLLLFDPDATTGSISWARGLGEVMVSPVIRNNGSTEEAS